MYDVLTLCVGVPPATMWVSETSPNSQRLQISLRDWIQSWDCLKALPVPAKHCKSGCSSRVVQDEEGVHRGSQWQLEWEL